jgi:hypothetical protein
MSIGARHKPANMGPKPLARDVLQTLQKPLEEALRGVGIVPGLNEDVEHNAIL